VLENDNEVLKWFSRPKEFPDSLHERGVLRAGLVVETKTAKFLCEPKAANEMTAEDVLAKAKAATKWCIHASAHEKQHGGKLWTYLLIPHDSIADNKTIQGLAATYTFGIVSPQK